MTLFEAGKLAVIGVIHLLPLPGSPRYGGSRDEIFDQALADGAHLVEGGVDGVIIENHGDAPFHKDDVGPAVVSEMTRIVADVRRDVQPRSLGVNVLRNDARSALAIAAACGGDFIRVNVHCGVFHCDQGTIEGRAAETLRIRCAMGADVGIWADVAVKHALPVAGFDIETAARDTAYRGLADALIVTGSGTGQPTPSEDLKRVRQAVPDRPLVVGSGVTVETLGELRALADAVIVGTALKVDGRVANPVDAERVKRFTTEARRI